MTKGSPGRHSNQAFSIGSESLDVVDEVQIEASLPNTPNQATMITSFCEIQEQEDTPLIMPVSSSPASERTPESEESEEGDGVQHHLVVDVFTIDDGNWRQKSRFARYEEDCEGFDNHFGKPHVPFIPMSVYHGLQQLAPKSILLPNENYTDIDDFCLALETKVNDQDHPGLGKKIVNLIQARIQSLERTRPLNKIHSTSTQSLQQGKPGKKDLTKAGIPRSLLSAPHNLGSLGVTPVRKLPTSVSGLRFRGSFLRDPEPTPHPLEPVIWDETNELSMLVTGVVPDVKVCRLIAVRFNETTEIQEIFPHMNNIRHIFFLIGPQLEEIQYLDMGRALATVASNPSSTDTFDKLKSPESITRAIERFLADTIVLAPGRIDNKNLVAGDLIRKMVNEQAEKHTHSTPKHVHPVNLDVEKNAGKDTENDSKRENQFLFGVLDDIKKRSKFYWSDFLDGFSPVILTVVVYMFCVTVVPTLTFGAILSLGTDGILAVKECLIGQALCGVIWSFFSCQPLLVMSPTGPFLVFEKALFQFTKGHDLDFMEVRFYTGLFLFLISVIGSSMNVAKLIRFVTIYTEDIFCALISMIFFYEVYEFLEIQNHHNRIQDLEYYINNSINCTGIPEVDCHLSRPNTFLLQMIMVVASIAVFHYLRQLSRSSFFGRSFRNLCGNFGGSFAVVGITVLYHVFFRNVEVSMVEIPAALGEHHPHGLLLIPTNYPSNSTLGTAIIAAPLLFVLLFVETEIPQQMALRESRKLKKGGGLHWDLIVAGFCTMICSIMGLPWQCPAAVQSLAHITALTVYKKSAPGEPSRASHVVEQRISGLVTYLSLGIFSVVGHFLSIPSAAIFGVFFYLGIRNLNGNLLLARVKMWFLPAKYRGNHKFLELAPFYVIGLYTFIQCAILIGMFIGKSTQLGGLLFPLMLVLCSAFVAKGLPIIFTRELLEALDGEDLEEDETETDNEENPVDFYYNTRIPV